MVLTSLITIIDGAFIVRNVGNEELTTVNLGLPILYFLLGITIMIGVGGSTIALNQLGAGDKKNANNGFMLTLSITLITILSLSLLLRFTLPVLLNQFNLEAVIQVYLFHYYKIMLFFYPYLSKAYDKIKVIPQYSVFN